MPTYLPITSMTAEKDSYDSRYDTFRKPPHTAYLSFFYSDRWFLWVYFGRYKTYRTPSPWYELSSIML